ncbi:MAG: type II toxin-antitoxin system VapC family toxin [Nitrospirota bacterium]|nr:type II toxin-antitoxin system VapC family toxin [Nitrospirota bacterium]
MNVVDSSGWLEFFADGPNATFFSKPLQDPSQLIVPSLSIFEVFKRILQQRGEHEALLAIAAMKQGQVIDLTTELAMAAANLSVAQSLPLADSVIYATARAYQAVLWTQDADFKGKEHVRYVVKKSL